MQYLWILDAEGNPVPTDDELMWGLWMKEAHRHVARDGDEETGWRVSTVFLGIDHNFTETGPPVLWETMIFATGCPLDGEQWRYTSREDALRGHEEAVFLLKAELALRASAR